MFFRQAIKHIAEKLGLSGFVKNEDDGSVTIVAEGEEENLQKFIEWAKVGTPLSRIDNIKIEWRGATGEFNSFEIK